MTNVKAFITSLKVTWLRRIITNSNNNNWSTLSNINFNSLCSLGDTYFRFLSKDLHNPFWKDVLESLYKYYSSFKIQDLDDILPHGAILTYQIRTIFSINIGLIKV